MPQFQLHAETVPGNGPPALLIHGLLSSRIQWRPNINALSRHIRPVLIDLWGHGLSPSPLDDDAYTVEAYVRQFDLIRQSLGISQVLMVAHSFGAGLAMHYAIRHPQHVRALVITNSTTAFADPDDAAVYTAREEMATAISNDGLEAIRSLPMHPRRGKRLPVELKDKLIDQADAVAPLSVLRAMRITTPGLSMRHELGHIACPVLLVNGRREAGFQKYRDIAEKEIPSCEVVDLDVGHAVNLEDSTGFNHAISAFLSRVIGDLEPAPRSDIEVPSFDPRRETT
ncbi:alpha/beta fold hydrolase [Variovorax sp. tm]|uniref:alpha/beta fold hydrolase n=1 Tax=Variovorax atrisoli TaxID=3394203 RepID=UPI003A7FCDF9